MQCLSLLDEDFPSHLNPQNFSNFWSNVRHYIIYLILYIAYMSIFSKTIEIIKFHVSYTHTHIKVKMLYLSLLFSCCST